MSGECVQWLVPVAVVGLVVLSAVGLACHAMILVPWWRHHRRR